jgi:serine/threonine protein kinase
VAIKLVKTDEQDGVPTGQACWLLKTLTQYSIFNWYFTQRAKREAAIWMPLNHPNLVPLLAFIEGRSLLVSPFYENGNIHKFLEDNPRTSWGCRLSFVTYHSFISMLHAPTVDLGC